MSIHGTESTIQKRQLMRGVADLFASALEGDAREEFLASAEARINRSYPAPSSGNMRAYLKSNLVR